LFLTKLVMNKYPKLAHSGEIRFTIFVRQTPVFRFKDKVERVKKKDRKTRGGGGGGGDDSSDEENPTTTTTATTTTTTTTANGVSNDTNPMNHSGGHGSSNSNNTTNEDDDGEDDRFVFDCSNIPLLNDVKFEFYEKSFSKNTALFQCWFNTTFVEKYHLRLEQSELDKANKDKNHKTYPRGFRIELYFKGSLHMGGGSGGGNHTTTTSTTTTTTTTPISPTTLIQSPASNSNVGPVSSSPSEPLAIPSVGDGEYPNGGESVVNKLSHMPKPNYRYSALLEKYPSLLNL